MHHSGKRTNRARLWILATALGVSASTSAFAASSCEEGNWRDANDNDRLAARVIAENETEDGHWYGRDASTSTAQHLKKSGTRLWREDFVMENAKISKTFNLSQAGSDKGPVVCTVGFEAKTVVRSTLGNTDVDQVMRFVSYDCDTGKNDVTVLCRKNWNPDDYRMTVRLKLRDPEN